MKFYQCIVGEDYIVFFPIFYFKQDSATMLYGCTTEAKQMNETVLLFLMILTGYFDDTESLSVLFVK